MARCFSAQQALNNSKYYWASAGDHDDKQAVTWTGVLSNRRKVSGVRISWAHEYNPNEVKVLISMDGSTFEEASCWKEIGNDRAEFIQNVKFDHPMTAKAVSVVMRGPGKAGYFGINRVAMLGDRNDPLLMINGPVDMKEGTAEAAGAKPSVGEGIADRILSKNQCLVADDEEGLGLEKCLSALLSNDGRGLFRLNDDEQLEHVSSGKCVVAEISHPKANSGTGAQVELKDCDKDDGDGGFQWELTEKGQLKTKNGNYCLMPANPLKEEESAQGTTVETTSSMAGHPASLVVDGDNTSYWASALDPAPDVPVEVTTVFENEKSLHSIEIDWEYPAKAFDVQVSNEEGAWTTIFTTRLNNAMKTKITEAEYPAEITEKFGILKGPTDSEGADSFKETPSVELPKNAKRVRVLMKEPHPDWGVEQGHTLYGIRNIKISASESKEIVVKDCDTAREQTTEDKRDRWSLDSAAAVMDTARRKVEISHINFL